LNITGAARQGHDHQRLAPGADSSWGAKADTVTWRVRTRASMRTTAPSIWHGIILLGANMDGVSCLSFHASPLMDV